jgi:hypothetical protein
VVETELMKDPLGIAYTDDLRVEHFRVDLDKPHEAASGVRIVHVPTGKSYSASGFGSRLANTSAALEELTKALRMADRARMREEIRLGESRGQAMRAGDRLGPDVDPEGDLATLVNILTEHRSQVDAQLDLRCACGHPYKPGESISRHRAEKILAAGFKR